MPHRSITGTRKMASKKKRVYFRQYRKSVHSQIHQTHPRHLNRLLMKLVFLLIQLQALPPKDRFH